MCKVCALAIPLPIYVDVIPKPCIMEPLSSKQWCGLFLKYKYRIVMCIYISSSLCTPPSSLLFSKAARILSSSSIKAKRHSLESLLMADWYAYIRDHTWKVSHVLVLRSHFCQPSTCQSHTQPSARQLRFAEFRLKLYSFLGFSQYQFVCCLCHLQSELPADIAYISWISTSLKFADKNFAIGTGWMDESGL